MPADTTTILSNALVLDTKAGAIAGERHVRIADGAIAEISETPIAAADARVIDLAGKVLMPGLVDGHVHVTAGTPNFAEMTTWLPSYVTAHAGQIMRDMLMRGFTTVRDAGGADFGLAAAVDEGRLIGPRLLFCGKALSQTGGHGDMRAPGQQTFEGCFCCAGLGQICDGIPEVRRACRNEIRRGATQLKIMASGGVSSPTDRIDSTQFSSEELAAIVEEATAANIYAMAHAYTARAVNRCLDHGVRTIEHGNLIDESSCAKFIEHDAWLVPTLSTYRALASEGVEAGMPAPLVAKVYDVLDAGIKALEMADRAGVKTVYGTDLLGSMHRHQLNEFAIRTEVQSPAEVIRAATCNAAEAFQRAGEFGVVETGARADLIVVDGNPLDDIGVLGNPDRYLKLVMKGGEVFRDEM